MSKKTLSIMVFVLVVCLPAVAFAVDDEPAAIRLADQIIEVVAYAIGITLAALIGKLVLAIERKFKVNVPDAAEQYLNGLLDLGIAYAEEQARKHAKQHGKRLEMNDSLEHAANFVLDMAEKRKVKEMGKEKLKKLIEARLNMTRTDSTPTEA